MPILPAKSPSSRPVHWRFLTPALVVTVVAATLGFNPVASAENGPPAPSHGDSHFRDGWRAMSARHGVALVWRAPQRLPMTDSRPEFRVAGRLLGYPRLSANGRTLRLVVPDVPSRTAALSVWLSGRRVDAPSPRATSARTPDVAPGPRRQLRVDPGEPGPYETNSVRYRMSPTHIPGFPEPVEMLGQVIAPVNAAGPRPFVLFLHGRHYTCFTPGTHDITGNWPCRRNEDPVPSYLGYRYAQRLLASQGYVTVSISANGINGQDWRVEDGGAAARSVLVRRHLRLWAQWATDGSAPANLRGPVAESDLSRVLLVGHSRGGEGVDRAAIDTRRSAPWRVTGQVLIGPTNFGRQEAPYVPTVVLLPYCDGDVIDLQGQQYVDIGRDVLPDPALRSSVLVMGANHNYFNSEWTPGVSRAPSFDDWYDQDDRVCGRHHEARLSGAEQRAVSRTYIAGAARLLIRDDERVLPMYDGARVRLASAKNADVRSTALGARRHLVRPGPKTQPVAGGAATRLCVGRSDGRSPQLCGHGVSSIRTPHWPPLYAGRVVPTNPAFEMSWQAARSAGGLVFRSPVSIAAAQTLDARVIVDPEAGPVQLDVRLTDDAGQSAVLTPVHQGRLRPLPGRDPLGKLWAQTLRVPLDGVAGIDLSRLSRLDLVARSATGHVWVLDVAGRRAGLRPVPDRFAPRVDLGTAVVDEGDGRGTATVNVPVRITGRLTRPARLSVQVVDYAADELPPPYVLTLRPGQHRASIPVTYEPDNLDDLAVRHFSVVAFPLRGAMTGDYLGMAQVRDDDPTPKATLTAVTDSLAEGAPLQWRVKLSRPVDYRIEYVFRAVRASGETHPLRTGDVPKRWLSRHGVKPPDKPVSLAATRLRLYVDIPPGKRSATMTIPTLVDGRAEPTETLSLRARPDKTLPDPQPVTVSVTDPG